MNLIVLYQYIRLISQNYLTVKLKVMKHGMIHTLHKYQMMGVMILLFMYTIMIAHYVGFGGHMVDLIIQEQKKLLYMSDAKEIW
ncbi:TPA: hypothetical protein MH199_09910 [Klebsiella pneumoniae]|nr:hypothetical protein [Klebsiella pneumoniae]